MEKYINEAIIGNNNIIATYTEKGELQRLYNSDKFRQYIDFSHVGVKINDSGIIYLHNDVNNTYKQYYDVNTNILELYIYLYILSSKSHIKIFFFKFNFFIKSK